MSLAMPHERSLPGGWGVFVSGVADRLRDVFPGAGVRVVGGRAEVDVTGAAAPASYRVGFDGGKVWVSLVTADRYLSQSIEQDLVHTGDSLPELLQEELLDLGFDKAGGSPTQPTPTQPTPTQPTPTLLAVEHFRDDAKLFTFRTALPIDPSRLDASAATLCVLAVRAYDATFRRLGDMEGGEESP